VPGEYRYRVPSARWKALICCCKNLSRVSFFRSRPNHKALPVSRVLTLSGISASSPGRSHRYPSAARPVFAGSLPNGIARWQCDVHSVCTNFHPHAHCVTPADGLALDRTRSVSLSILSPHSRVPARISRKSVAELKLGPEDWLLPYMLRGNVALTRPGFQAAVFQKGSSA
jgi:hypothetical protein